MPRMEAKPLATRSTPPPQRAAQQLEQWTDELLA